MQLAAGERLGAEVGDRLVLGRADHLEEGAAGRVLGRPPASPKKRPSNRRSPFSGSGLFKLGSPTKASWTGDLGVEIPTLGVVGLTGPKSSSALCIGTECTKASPSTTEFGWIETQTIY
jgi:hypothetical protein